MGLWRFRRRVGWVYGGLGEGYRMGLWRFSRRVMMGLLRFRGRVE